MLGALAMCALLAGCDAEAERAAGPASPEHAQEVAVDAAPEAGADVLTATLPLILEEEGKILAEAGADRQGFGHALSLRGARAVVAGAGHPAFMADGLAVLLERSADAPSGWSEVATLVAPDDASRARLGAGDWVALLDGRVFVGSGVAFGPGAAEAGAGLDVFEAGGWDRAERLVPPPPLTADRGPTVAADGVRLLLGGPSPPGPSADVPGVAWIYERIDGAYTLQATLSPPEGAPPGWGHALALDGDLAVVGSGVPGAFSPTPGAVHLFRRSADGSWALDQVLTVEDAPDDALFGFSVALSGDRLLVGAPADDSQAGTATGAAYLFERGGDGAWVRERKLSPPDGATQDRFGHAVDLDGAVAAVGAPGHPVSPPESPGARPVIGPGAVYVFGRNTSGTGAWGLAARVVPSDGESQPLPTFANAPGPSRMGASVALDDGILLVGAPGDDNERGADAGAVYVRSLDLDSDGVPDVMDACADTPPSDAAAGVPGIRLGLRFGCSTGLLVARAGCVDGRGCASP
ncbi:MAG: FG-GAP repeat protein [Myxococcota bacterium]